MAEAKKKIASYWKKLRMSYIIKQFVKKNLIKNHVRFVTNAHPSRLLKMFEVGGPNYITRHGGGATADLCCYIVPVE